MTNFDPFIIRCARQVYCNLKMTGRAELLSNTSGKPLAELNKMQQVMLLFDKKKLESIVIAFLQNSKHNKTLEDFVAQLDLALEAFSAEVGKDDDEFDEFDDYNFEAFAKLTTVKKRERSPFEDNMSTTKKIRSDSLPSKTSSIPCFSVEIKNTESYNIICSPGGSSKIFDKVPWIILYEIARFVQAYDVKWNELPFDAFQMFLTVANKDYTRLYEAMVKWNQETRLGQKLDATAYTKMERCPENAWIHMRKTHPITGFLNAIESQQTETQVAYPTIIDSSRKSTTSQRMIHYSGTLHFDTDDDKPTIVLRAPKVEASNRLFRKFGQDRFFELKLPLNTPTSFIKTHSHYFLKPFLFMQRTFKFLFIKDDIVILFATEGENIQPISIQQVIDWHMPITENWSMSMSKYASRMSLGYSSSIPTLKFKPEEIIYIDDEYAENGAGDETACMTDGCGIISCSAMQQIMGCQATDILPCAVQGRIAGAKGIWIIAPDLDFTSGNYIKIRKSQNKFKTGLPQSDLSLDPHHYTFDLVKNSICVYPSNLNTQFIQALSAGGVPTSVFVEILKEYIHRLATIVTENQNIKLLRDWVAKTGNIMTGRWENESNTEKGLWQRMNPAMFAASTDIDDETDSGVFTMDSPDNNDTEEDDRSPEQQQTERTNASLFKTNKFSGHPYSLHEVIVRLLDAGYDLSNAYLASRVTMVFRQIMQSITIKYKIEVPYSCTLTCVPDPTGTLEAGEVFLQLSSQKKDEKTGVRVGQVLGDVIVTRNPCGLKSDVQKVKAVDSTALKMYTDIIVFSIKGECSLASQLSGGDYDGDMVFCCWDERIVKPFTPSPMKPEPSRARDAFDKDDVTVGSEVGHCQDPERALQRNFLSVSIPDGTLGTYENWRTVLAERDGLDNPHVSYLAHMCAKLVDAPKQGLRLKSHIREEDRSIYAETPHPLWFMDKRFQQRKNGLKPYHDLSDIDMSRGVEKTTTMDFLYDTLMKETAKFTKYSHSMFLDRKVTFKDTDLTDPWTRALELSAQLNDGDKLKRDLGRIKAYILQNHREYKAHCLRLSKRLRNRKSQNDSNDASTSTDGVPEFDGHFELEEYYAKEFLDNPSIKDLESSVLYFDIQVNGGRMYQSIKASYAYILSLSDGKYSKYCYAVAFDALRRVKADATAKKIKENGLAESVSTATYKSMSIDRSWIRKIRELTYSSDKVKEIENYNKK